MVYNMACNHHQCMVRNHLHHSMVCNMACNHHQCMIRNHLHCNMACNHHQYMVRNHLHRSMVCSHPCSKVCSIHHSRLGSHSSIHSPYCNWCNHLHTQRSMEEVQGPELIGLQCVHICLYMQQ